MKPSVPGILGILLSCLLTSCAEPPPVNIEPITTISGNLVIYPDLQQNVLHPEDSVLFEFTSTGASIDINSVQINPGEPGAPLFVCGRNASCFGNTIRANYTYKNKGHYNMSVQYSGEVLAEQQILILEHYLTDEELRYEAIKKIATEIKPVLQKKVRGGKIAFSALKNANFEYAADQRDVEIIYGLMQALVGSNTGYAGRSNYVILERAPHALVRLAHEAVYTAKNLNSRPEKQKKLEYGLSTANEGLDRPLVYRINSSGLNDSSVSLGTKENVNLRREGEVNPSSVRSVKEKGAFHQKTHQERPVMFARFDTADFLVVVDRLEDEPVQRSAADYYDSTYNAKAIKRTAKVKINVRLLDDNGRILWIKDFTKQASDLVIPKYAPLAQKWVKSKAGEPAQYPAAVNPITGLINAMTIDPITGIFRAVDNTIRTVGEVTSSLSE